MEFWPSASNAVTVEFWLLKPSGGSTVMKPLPESVAAKGDTRDASRPSKKIRESAVRPAPPTVRLPPAFGMTEVSAGGCFPATMNASGSTYISEDAPEPNVSTRWRGPVMAPLFRKSIIRYGPHGSLAEQEYNCMVAFPISVPRTAAVAGMGVGPELAWAQTRRYVLLVLTKAGVVQICDAA